MVSPKNWYATADNAAMAALPEHLRLFITTPEAYYEAAPTPVVVGEEQWVLAAFCEKGGRGWPDDPRTVYAPRVLQWIHYPSGDFRWEEPTPNAYGLPTASTDALGLCLGPIQRGHLPKNAWHEAGMRYFSLVRQVVEARWLVTAYPVTAEERETARELQACTQAYYDAPLLPYYRHYGHHFLAWMERAAK